VTIDNDIPGTEISPRVVEFDKPRGCGISCMESINVVISDLTDDRTPMWRSAPSQKRSFAPRESHFLGYQPRFVIEVDEMKLSRS